MNKRQEAKRRKNIFINEIINPIKNAGFHVNPKFLDGYFLFTFGKNSVCHFTVDELPMIKFGVWMNYDHKKFVIFAEDLVHYDKFKPTRCYNFSGTQDVIDLLNGYKSKKITFKQIICDLFQNEWHEYEGTDEEYYEDYLKRYDDWLFSVNHNYLSREEWDQANKNLDNVLEWMKNNKYIQVVLVSKKLPFMFDAYGVDYFYSNEIDNLSDEELTKLEKEIFRKIRYTDNDESTHLTFHCTCLMNDKLSWKETIEKLTDKNGNLKENMYFAKGSLDDFHD